MNYPERHGALIATLEREMAMGSLNDEPLEDLLARFCVIARDGGLPLCRTSVSWRLIHPIYHSRQLVWRHGVEISELLIPHGDLERETVFQRSPIFHALKHGIEIARYDLTDPDQQSRFELFDSFIADGMTDYVVFAIAFGDAEGEVLNNPSAGVAITFATDAPTGFSAEDYAALERLRYMLAIAVRTTMLRADTRSVLGTYLARSAGEKVMSGTLALGDGEEIDAIIWYCDLRRSTTLTEMLGTEKYLALLNDFFAATAGPVVDHGGDVMDFIGDAVLAIFPLSDNGGDRARAATVDALRRVEAFRQKHQALLGNAGSIADVMGIAIDVGSVTYGNIGIPSRLTFSVIGSSVNKVTRIERYTKELQQPVLFTEPIGLNNADNLRCLGVFEMEGLAAPEPLYGMKPDVLRRILDEKHFSIV